MTAASDLSCMRRPHSMACTVVGGQNRRLLGRTAEGFGRIDRRTCHPSVVLAIAFAICPSMTLRMS